MVTNPGTRDWTVTASLFATLNEMFGNRTVCGIGRGDSARALPSGDRPVNLAELRRVDRRDPRTWPRARRSSYGDTDAAVPVVAGHPALEVWMAAYGPKALTLAARWPTASSCSSPTRDIAAWMIEAVRAAAAERRARPRRRSRSASPPPPTSATTWRTSATSAAGSAAWSATTSPTSWPATATDGAGAAGADRLHQGPPGLRLRRARPGRQHPHRLRARRDRRPVLHPRPGRGAPRAPGRARATLGVDQFAVYLQHDAKDETLEAYGASIIPALRR